MKRAARESVCPEAAAGIARQKLAALGLLTMLGCASLKSAAPTLDELACYKQADADAQEMVDLLCPGVPFMSCANHDAIMSRLEQAQKACRQ